MSFLPAAMAVVSAVGGIFGAFGQAKEGQQINQANQYNAQIAEQEAGVVRQNAVLNEYRQRKSLTQNVGAMTAAYAKSGVSVSTGSPLDVIADSISNAELDISISKYNSEAEARNKESQAKMMRWQGLQARNLGYAKAGSTLLTTATSAASALSKEKLLTTPKKKTIGEA